VACLGNQRVFAAILRIPISRLLDCLDLFLGLALALSGMGCLWAGRCHGRVCTWPLAYRYSPESTASACTCP